MYIDDLVKGIILIMNSESNIVNPINLGNPNEITINELASMIIKYTNSNSKIIYKELPEDDPKRRKPNILKANKILNWKPTLSLSTGLIKTIENFKNTREDN